MGFADTWTNADPEGNNDNPPPDGTYDVALMDTGAFTAKASGDDFVKFSWQTVDRQYHWDQLGGFGSLKQAGFTKGQCKALGVDVDACSSLEEVGEALAALVGKYYEVKVVRNEGGDRVFVNTYIEDGEVTPAGKVEPDVPADTSDLQPVPDGAGADADFKF